MSKGNKSRIIFHIDMNSFYASVECLHRPQLRKFPLAVGGNSETRHGIILAKNEYAKAYGVKTGEAIWQAKNKCPSLVIVPPDYRLYLRYSQLAKNIYTDYTPLVESFGLDECWLDLSGSIHSYLDASYLAEEIHQRIIDELGLTVSIGVSWNKIFAKLGSDMFKPDGTAIITPANYQDRVWELDVEDLLYVGYATKSKLNKAGIKIIGDLAHCDSDWLVTRLGKVGLMLKRFALGDDNSPVHSNSISSEIKSIGNSITTPRDIQGLEDLRLVFGLLVDSVSARLRELGFLAQTLSITVRDTGLIHQQAQITLREATNLSLKILEQVMCLYELNFSPGLKIRSLGVRLSKLSPELPVQENFLPEKQRLQQLARIDRAIDQLRSRFGYQKVLRASALKDELAQVDAKTEHIINPVAYIKGGERIC